MQKHIPTFEDMTRALELDMINSNLIDVTSKYE